MIGVIIWGAYPRSASNPTCVYVHRFIPFRNISALVERAVVRRRRAICSYVAQIILAAVQGARTGDPVAVVVTFGEEIIVLEIADTRVVGRRSGRLVGIWSAVGFHWIPPI